MKKVLIFADHYLPGYKAGGPIRSISSICSAVSNSCDVYLITRDRDMKATEPYDNIPVNQWVERDGIKIMYKRAEEVNAKFLVTIFKEIRPNTVHLNSSLSLRFSFFPLLTLRYLMPKGCKVLLSPRGEFSSGALSLKKYQKIIYLGVFRLLGLDKFVQWIASSEGERKDIIKKFPSKKNVIHRIDNMPSINFWKEELQRTVPKQPKVLKMVFLSRISKMKNFVYLLETLQSVKIDVSLAIYGPYEDKNYYKQCKAISDNLPSHIKVEYCGPVSGDKVYETIKDYDLFFLPTLGENFGQAIWEAMASALPVLISDQTPWKNLVEQGVGWDVSLERPEEFVGIIEQVYEMDEQQHSVMRNKSRDYALSYVANSESTKLIHNLYAD